MGGLLPLVARTTVASLFWSGLAYGPLSAAVPRTSFGILGPDRRLVSSTGAYPFAFA